MPPKGTHLMNRERLAKCLSERCVGLNLDYAQIMVTALFDGISKALVAGDRVEIRGFGIFKIYTMPAGVYWNAYLRKRVKYGPRKYVRFKPSETLRLKIR